MAVTVIIEINDNQAPVTAKNNPPDVVKSSVGANNISSNSEIVLANSSQK